MSSSLARMRAFLIRLARSVRGRSGAGEFDEELEANIAMHTEAGIAAGLDAAEARRQALVKLGGAEQVRLFEDATEIYGPMSLKAAEEA